MHSRRDSFRHRAYVLIIDGLWFTFQGEDWVLYVMAVKPVDKHFALFLDPVLLKGKEACRRWKQAIGTIPANLQKTDKGLCFRWFFWLKANR